MQKISPNNVNKKNKNKRGFRHIKGVYFRKLNLTTINKFYYTIITENNELLFKSNITEKTLVKKINKNKNPSWTQFDIEEVYENIEYESIKGKNKNKRKRVYNNNI
jgi:hypothetical protein